MTTRAYSRQTLPRQLTAPIVAFSLFVAVGPKASASAPLAAATEDRFLMPLGLKQRFGTLPVTLAPVDDGPAAVIPRVRQLMLDTVPLLLMISQLVISWSNVSRHQVSLRFL